MGTADAFCDPANTFHEKALLCRAAENSCYFATVNYASAGSPMTSAIINPDGTVMSYQPCGGGRTQLFSPEVAIELVRRARDMRVPIQGSKHSSSTRTRSRRS